MLGQELIPLGTRQFAGALLLLVSSVAVNSARSTDPVSYLDDACWDETFSEDFTSLDLWDPETQSGRWKTSYIWDRTIRINNELQYYVDPSIHAVNPFFVSDGILTITASTTPAALKPDVQDSEYISGVLTTEPTFSQQFGRFETRAKVPLGKGLWPAFWLLPSFDEWPDGVAVLPEIDVMEFLGHEPTTYHTTLHTNQTGDTTSHQYTHETQVDLSNDFHLYAVVWDNTNVSWYFDGKKVATHPTPADFSRPVHFLLNLAVGGNWPGNPERQTHFPAAFSIDYVKAYKAKSGCGE